jgi:hypothetical protein
MTWWRNLLAFWRRRGAPPKPAPPARAQASWDDTTTIAEIDFATGRLIPPQPPRGQVHAHDSVPH